MLVVYVPTTMRNRQIELCVGHLGADSVCARSPTNDDGLAISMQYLDH